MSLLLLILLAGIAAYVQTLTGFAFGLVLMGGIATFGLASIQDAATIVGLLSLANCFQMIGNEWRHIMWREFILVAIPNLGATVIGFALLSYFAELNLSVVRSIMGIVIIGSSIQLLLRPSPLATRSPAHHFFMAGAVGGLMNGLFAIPGPPLVYHFYRQPMAMTSIRVTLVMVFGVGVILRLAMVGASDLPKDKTVWLSLLAVPFILVTTAIAQRWPPAISAAGMRRLVFALMLMSGISLIQG